MSVSGRFCSRFFRERCYLGVIAGYQREWRIAISQMHAATVVNPNLAPAWSNLATAYIQIGEFTNARECAHRAITIDSRNPIYWMTSAFAHLALADTVAATEAVEAALRADANFAPATSLKAVLTDRSQ